MPVYLGLDCGGSSTRALALDESGAVVFQGQGGPANLASTPPRKLQYSLETALQAHPKIEVACGCFAGLLTHEDRARAVDLLQALLPNAKIDATPDYAAALYACDEGTDICVIAGTGSLVCSKGVEGIAKSGGLGYLLGDEGSGFRYGQAALRAYLNEPSNASNALRSAVVKFFGCGEPNEIVSRVYRQSAPAAALAKLAKALATDAANGIRYATKALDEQTEALAAITARHIRQHFAGRTRLGVCLAGGLWQTASLFRDTFMRVLKEKAEEMELVGTRINHPPVFGAVRLAQEMAHGN